jgi:hypothetical protein
MADTGDKLFRITTGKGFQIKFPNGVVASVQWGNANYVEDRELMAPYGAEKLADIWGRDNAEIMAWVEGDTASSADKSAVTRKLYPDGEMNDDVKGWLSPVEVLDFLNRCANYKVEQ